MNDTLQYSNYVNMYKLLHASDQKMFAGFQSMFLIDYFKIYVDYFNIKTVFDYGCGKGLQYFVGKIHKNWNVDSVCLFDIGLDEFSIKPPIGKKFDGVLCLDVMEHLEENMIESVVKEILNYSNNLCLFTICTRPAKKTLPDGRNAHLTVKPAEWWLKKFEKIYESLCNEFKIAVESLPKSVLLFEEGVSTSSEKKTKNYFLNFKKEDKIKIEEKIKQLHKTNVDKV